MEELGDILKRLGTKGTTRANDHTPAPDPETDEVLEPCEICGGRGWFTPDVPVGHPDFGQITTCRCQEERMEEERFSRLLRYSNIGSLTRFTFESLQLEGLSKDPENQRLFKEAHDTAAEYAQNPIGWLVLTGPNGSGKTHLAAAIANRCIQNGYVVLFVHLPDLLDHLRATFAPASDVSYSELFEQVKGTPVLILDALGAQASTSWAQEKLQQIVNHRFNAELPTVVTTAARLEELDPYIYTRLATGELSRVLEVWSPAMDRVLSLGRIEPEMLNRMTFDAFDVRGNNPTAGQRASLEAAFQAAKNFAADPDGWLTLFGETGVGKTHLAVAVASKHVNQGRTAFYAFVPELLDYLRYTFSPDSRITYDRLFEEVKNTPMLILDDLGGEHSTPWAQEKLYQIIVHRHDARLPTVITTTEDFTQPTGAISSRVQDPSVGQLIRIEAPDYRIKKRDAHRQRSVSRRTRGAG